MKRDNPEQRLQIAVAAYLGHALKPPTIWTAFPAGGGGKIRGAFLKAMGLQPGWPDILVMHPWGGLPKVIGIELKSTKGRAATNQVLIEDGLRKVGAAYQICRSVEQVEDCLRSCGIPLSATVARAA
jgi:hypothetical protein